MPEGVLYILALVLSLYGLAALIRRFISMFVCSCDTSRTAVLVRPCGDGVELQLRGALQAACENGLNVVVVCDLLDAEGERICHTFEQKYEQIILCSDIDRLRECIYT